MFINRTSKLLLKISHTVSKRCGLSTKTQLSSKIVYVGNLAWDVDWNDLKQFAQGVGPVVHADIILEPLSGKSQGYGLIEFANIETAESAIKTLDGKSFRGRVISVKPYRQDPKNETADTHKVYVDKIPLNTKWHELKDHLKTGGDVKNVKIYDSKNGKYCSAIAEFSSPEDAAQAIKLMQGSELNGRRLFLREDRGELKLNSNFHSSRHIYVENLANEVRWQDLKDLFKTGAEPESKRYGVVEFARDEDAKSAIYLMNTKVFMGQQIRVTAKPPLSQYVPSKLKSDGLPRNALYVENLPLKSSWKELKDHLRSGGDILNVSILRVPDGTRSYGIAEFSSAKDAENALLTLQNTMLHGKRLYLSRKLGSNSKKTQ